jgi:hypothetical protein
MAGPANDARNNLRTLLGVAWPGRGFVLAAN